TRICRGHFWHGAISTVAQSSLALDDNSTKDTGLIVGMDLPDRMRCNNCRLRRDRVDPCRRSAGLRIGCIRDLGLEGEGARARKSLVASGIFFRSSFQLQPSGLSVVSPVLGRRSL